jgi:hypothetical protein
LFLVLLVLYFSASKKKTINILREEEKMTNDGGQAFPIISSEGWGCSSGGMTLRDYFAGQALAGMVIKYAHQINTEEITRNTIAGQAYKVADAMLAKRGKGE